MSQKALYYAVGWVVVVAFSVTLFVTIGALIGRFQIEPHYMKVLFVKLVLEVIAAALFLFYRGPGKELPPYSGEWRGTVSWHDDWAAKLMNPEGKLSNFEPVHPRSEGELYIYQGASGVYKGFSTWTVKNDDTAFSVAAVIANNFVFSAEGSLISFDVRAHSRRVISEGASYGPSPLYTWHFTENDKPKLKGTMTTIFGGKEVGVGSVLLERQ